MNNNTVQKKLNKLGIEFEHDYSLQDLTNTQTGGVVSFLVFPHEVEELKEAIRCLKELLMPVIVLGDMTNVAIASGKLNFNVICMSHFKNNPVFDCKSNIVTVYAGYKMKKLSKWAIEHSISGLQWMEGIPGTVGAGVYMNAGFLPGQDFQNHVIDAQVLMPDLSIRTLTNKELCFQYRFSSLQKNGGIVLSTRLLVRKGKKWKIKLRVAQYHNRRARNQPLDFPSAGTVFVPPTPFHVGGMLPKLGLIGYRIGGAQVSKKSPGFIIGIDHMTGEDYYTLVRFIQKKVKASYGIELEPEVRLLGFETIDKQK